MEKLYSLRAACIHVMAAIPSAILLCTSCSDGDGKPMVHVNNSPAGTYRDYLYDIRRLENLPVDTLSERLKQWQAVRDSVFLRLEHDTLAMLHQNAVEDCRRLHDSIRMEFSRLALLRPRTYKDMLAVKERVSLYAADKELHSAADVIRPFFVSLDCNPPCRGSKQQVMKAYRTLLAETICDDIRSIANLTTYIQKEDAAFRAFLSHLHHLDGEELADITRDTERCCSLVFLAAERNDITYREAMIYLAMRTNRRLILNARTCIDDIRDNKVRTPAQAQAYIWMILQPYSSLDSFCISLLSPDERKHLDALAMQTPDAFRVLSRILHTGDTRLDELPGMLIEAYIHTL